MAYINKDLLLKDIEDSLQGNPHKYWLTYKAHNEEHNHFLALVMKQPTADVEEVVRCRDCAYRVEIPNGKEFNGRKPKYCWWLQQLTSENDYCSHGVRKDEG